MTPSKATLKTYENESVRFQITATSSRVFEKPFNVAVLDSKGVIAPEMTLTRVGELSYMVDLRTSALKAGVYQSYLEVRLCEDDPQICRVPLPGSPWYVPVSVDVAGAAQAQDRLKLSPAALDLTTYDGEPVSFSLDFAGPFFEKHVSIGVFDNSGLLAENKALYGILSVNGRFDLASSPTLPVGEHVSSLEVRMCYDDPRVCQSPVTGSPWRVPLKVNVKSGNTFKPLSPISSLLPWTGRHGNAAQNAYVPASFTPAAFTRRWLKLDSPNTYLNLPVIENGRLFSLRTNAAQREVVAMSEASGEILWRYTLPSGGWMDSVTTGSGRVYIVTQANGDSVLTMLDQTSGELIGQRQLNLPNRSWVVPTIAGDIAYLGGGLGMDKLNLATGTFEWENKSLQVGTVTWPPSVEGNHVYTLSRDRVYELDTRDGSILSSFPDPALALTTLGGNPAMSLQGQTGVVSSGYQLFAYDLYSGTRSWTAQTFVIGQPVLANGTVYTLAGDQERHELSIEARSAASGVVSWKSAPLPGQVNVLSDPRIIVTSNLVFVTLDTQTVALDLATHGVVWSYPMGGRIALSEQGVLYIKGTNGKLAAINLR